MLDLKIKEIEGVVVDSEACSINSYVIREGGCPIIKFCGP